VSWLPGSGERLGYPIELEAYEGEFGDWDYDGAERGIFISIK